MVYLERIDKFILEEDPLGDEAKTLDAIVRLKKGTKLWWSMTSIYPANYSKFRSRVSKIIHTLELLAAKMEE